MNRFTKLVAAIWEFIWPGNSKSRKGKLLVGMRVSGEDRRFICMCDCRNFVARSEEELEIAAYQQCKECETAKK